MYVSMQVISPLKSFPCTYWLEVNIVYLELSLYHIFVWTSLFMGIWLTSHSGDRSIKIPGLQVLSAFGNVLKRPTLHVGGACLVAACTKCLLSFSYVPNWKEPDPLIEFASFLRSRIYFMHISTLAWVEWNISNSMRVCSEMFCGVSSR